MKNKNQLILIGIVLLVFAFGSIILSNNKEQNEINLLKNDINDETINDIDKEMPKDSAVLVEKKIDGSAGWTKAIGEGWVTGNGISGDPYKIQDLTFSGDNDNNSLIIQNSDYYFEINNCTFINAGTLNNQAGLVLQDTHNGTIIGNNFSTGVNTKGIILDDCNNNTFKNNLIHDSFVGIEMMGSSLENKIINNTIYDLFSEAIYIRDYSHDTTIENNTITNCGSIGIDILRSKCMVVNNTISDHSYAGININNIASGLTQLINNTIINSNDGILLWSTNDTTIRGNIIEDCDSHGIRIHLTPNTIVSGNKLSNCGIVNSERNSRFELRTTTIYPNNTVNGKPVYFYKHEISLGAANFINAGQVILYNCSYSEISNLNTSHSSVGIALHYCENNTISDNMVRGNGVHGIGLYQACINNTIYNNTLINNDYGIYVYQDCVENIIDFNQITGCVYGVYLDYDCEKNVIEYNIITGCDEGIRIYYSSNNNFTSNTIKNGPSNSYGIRLRESELNLIWNNTIIDHYRAIYFWDKCHNNTISFNYITNTTAGPEQRYGVHLNNNCDDNTISENNITGLSDGGIFFQGGCDDNEISYNNILDNNYYGIYFDIGGGNNNMIKFNNVSNNGQSSPIRVGILFWGSVYNNTIYGNIIEHNGYTGIGMWQYCTDNKILNNTVNYNGRRGIYLSTGCDDNLIKNNTIIDNGQYGIHLYDDTSDCNDNEIINNTIHDNGVAGIYLNGKVIYTKIINNTIKYTGTGGSQNYGIYLEDVDGFILPNYNTIRNNTIMDNEDYGIYLNIGGDENEIIENTIVENNGIGGTQKRGIYLKGDCGNNTIYKNRVLNQNEYGIYLDGADDNNISSNTVMDNSQHGIYLIRSNDNIIKNNTISNQGWYGIYINDGCDFTIIENNTMILNTDGIRIENNCHNTTIVNNTLHNNDGYGIILRDTCDNTTIIKNIIYNNILDGILLWKNCDNNRILNNTIFWTFEIGWSQRNGIYLNDTCHNNRISYNAIYYNKEHGIYLNHSCHHTIISYNHIFNNSLDGIKLRDDIQLTNIFYNTLNNNSRYGIFLTNHAVLTKIRGNVIANNSQIGLFIDNISDNGLNYIYENYFRNNTLHARDDEVDFDNYWYDSTNKIGNYWDNYTGSDPDDDGIGSPEHDILGDGNRKDLYPIWWDDDTPPIVLIIEPSAGTYGPASLLINASIIDTYGTVTQVLAMINAPKPFNISMVLSGSYWISNWDNISLYASGDYIITIWAIDNSGNINATENIIITIDTDGPSVLIIEPSAGIYGSASLLINASITDVTQAVAMINASTSFTIPMTLSGSYWNCSWNNISLYTSADYSITIWAIDNNGNINATEYVVITIAKDGTPRAPGAPSAGDDDDDDDEDGIIPGYDISILIAIISLFSVLFILNRRKILLRLK